MFLTNNNQKKDNSIYEDFLMHIQKIQLLDRDLYAQSLPLQVLKSPLFNISFCIIGKFDYDLNFCIVKLIQPVLILNWLALHHDQLNATKTFDITTS